MKVFFVASIHGKEKYQKNYEEIVRLVKDSGYVMVADHIMEVTKEELEKWDEDQNISFHRKVLAGIKGADIVMAEVSHPSMSVGYLLSMALDMGKPIIALYAGEEEPHLLQTLSLDEKFQAVHYAGFDNLKKELLMSLDFASDQQDTRFNFFVSPRHQHYLDWISRKRMVPRAVHLRKLLERDMDENKEYQAELVGGNGKKTK